MAAQILLRDGRTADQVRRAAVPLGRVSATAVPRTPAAEEVLARAEVLAAGAPIGSQHLLEALAMTSSGVAGRALAGSGRHRRVPSAPGSTTSTSTGTGDSTPELAGRGHHGLASTAAPRS